MIQGEVSIGLLAALSVGFTNIYAFLHMLGGRSIEELGELAFWGDKSNRIYGRLIAPLFFSLSVIGLSLLSDTFHYPILVMIPAYLVISHMGHHTFPKRLLENWCYALPSVLILFTCKDVWMFCAIQMLLATVSAVIGHFVNEKPAPVIEFLIAFLRVCLIPIMVI
jgi:hypothetical protein